MECLVGLKLRNLEGQNELRAGEGSTLEIWIE